MEERVLKETVVVTAEPQGYAVWRQRPDGRTVLVKLVGDPKQVSEAVRSVAAEYGLNRDFDLFN